MSKPFIPDPRIAKILSIVDELTVADKKGNSFFNMNYRSLYKEAEKAIKECERQHRLPNLIDIAASVTSGVDPKFLDIDQAKKAQSFITIWKSDLEVRAKIVLSLIEDGRYRPSKRPLSDLAPESKDDFSSHQDNRIGRVLLVLNKLIGNSENGQSFLRNNQSFLVKTVRDIVGNFDQQSEENRRFRGAAVAEGEITESDLCTAVISGIENAYDNLSQAQEYEGANAFQVMLYGSDIGEDGRLDHDNIEIRIQQALLDIDEQKVSATSSAAATPSARPQTREGYNNEPFKTFGQGGGRK